MTKDEVLAGTLCFGVRSPACVFLYPALEGWGCDNPDGLPRPGSRGAIPELGRFVRPGGSAACAGPAQGVPRGPRGTPLALPTRPSTSPA